MTSWQAGGRGNFRLSEENCGKMFFLWENFGPAMQNLGLKTSLGKFKGRIEILGTHNLFCRKFAAVCRTIATFCPSYFFNPPCRWSEMNWNEMYIVRSLSTVRATQLNWHFSSVQFSSVAFTRVQGWPPWKQLQASRQCVTSMHSAPSALL